MKDLIKFVIALTLAYGLSVPTLGSTLQHPDAYPDGHFCTPEGTVVMQPNGRYSPPDGMPAHKCACVRIVHDEDCEGEPMEDNIRCLQRCHKEHCHCPVACDTTPKAPQAPAEPTEGEPQLHKH